MIRVKFVYEEGDVVEVTVKGHAGYAPRGKDDIVCSTVSGVVFTALLGLTKFSTSKVETKQDEETGYLNFKVPKPKSEEERLRQQTILETMLLGLRDIEGGYKAYLKTEV